MERFFNSPSQENPPEKSVEENNSEEHKESAVPRALDLSLHNKSSSPERFREEKKLESRGRDLYEDAKYQNFKNITDYEGLAGFEPYKHLLEGSEEEMTPDDFINIGLHEKFLKEKKKEQEGANAPQVELGSSSVEPDREVPQSDDSAKEGSVTPGEFEVPENVAASIYATDLYREAMRRQDKKERKASKTKEEPELVYVGKNNDSIEVIEETIDLNSAREDFARSELSLAREGLKGKRIEDVARAEEAAYTEHVYRSALKKERQDLVAGLGEVEDRERRIKEALLKTTALEAVNLFDKKTEIIAKEREGGFSESIVKKVQAAERWYRSLRPRNKILIAGGLLAAGGAGAALGGVIGASMVGAALTGKTIQRVFAGAGIGVALEQAMKSAQESKERRAIERAFGREGGEKIIEIFENSSSALDEALLRIESKQGRHKVQRYVLAATGGGLLASGVAASAFEYVSENTSGFVESIRERLGLSEPPQEGFSSLPGPDLARSEIVLPGSEVVPSPEFYVVEPGDTMYAVLEKSFPEVTALEGQAQANAIENILAVIKESPTEFGIQSGDVNILSVGDKIDLEKINEVLENERIGDRSIAEHAKSFLEDDVVAEPSVVERVDIYRDLEDQLSLDADTPQIERGESYVENIPPAETAEELREFFRQTPGYLTRTVALEEFMEMIERGSVDAEMFRSFEESVVGSDHNLSPDRYQYEFDVIRQGEGVYGLDEVARVERELGSAFDRLWAGPGPEDFVSKESLETDSTITETETITEFDPEAIHSKLDNIFSEANAQVDSYVEKGEGYSIEGRINDYDKLESSFNSFIDLIKEGALSAEYFAEYVSESGVTGARATASYYDRAFELIRDPSSYQFSLREVGVAHQTMKTLFQAMWLERSR